MIKALNISPLNTSNELHCKCESCNFECKLFLENPSIVNIDNNGNIEEPEFKEITCPKCEKIIS